MATIINNPNEDDSGFGILIGVIVGILLIALFFIYALPVLRSAPPENSGAIKVEIPVPGNTGSNNSGQNPQ